MTFVGTDIVSISRIDKLIHENGNKFLDHIFTNTEQELCNSRTSPSQHYSGKFAAKEAVKKAILSSMSILKLSLRSIEICSREDGMPIVNIQGSDIKFPLIRVSISHTEEHAIATAILELK